MCAIQLVTKPSQVDKAGFNNVKLQLEYKIE